MSKPHITRLKPFLHRHLRSVGLYGYMLVAQLGGAYVLRLPAFAVDSLFVVVVNNERRQEVMSVIVLWLLYTEATFEGTLHGFRLLDARVGHDIMGDPDVAADDAVMANGDATQDGGIGIDGDVVLDDGVTGYV